jgi:hypothetical protein
MMSPVAVLGVSAAIVCIMEKVSVSAVSRETGYMMVWVAASAIFWLFSRLLSAFGLSELLLGGDPWAAVAAGPLAPAH